MGKSIDRLGQQNFSKRLILFMSSLAILRINAATNDNLDIQLGLSTDFYKLSSNEVKYFQVKMDADQFTGVEDLIIKVQSAEHKGDPDLYISKDNSKPNSISNSDYACETSGRDICTVNHKYLSKGKYIYIGVKCLEDCRFKLTSNLFEPISLEDGTEMQMDFGADQTKLFKYYVPSTSASKDVENRVNSVTITATPLLAQQDNIILTASAAKDDTPTTKSKRAVAGWRKGQVLRLSEFYGKDWCSDCWITILVDVSEIGKYSILAKSNVGVMQLQQDQKLDDVAFYGDKTCYKYYIQSADTDLNLKVQQYSGLISFTVNPKKPAESFDSAAFKYVGAQNSVLKITSQDRQKASQPKGLYYICAIPHMTSTYSILVQEQSKNQVFTYLDDSYDETGEVQGSNLILYVYKVPPLEYRGEDIQLNFRLTTVSGKTPQMAAAFCTEQKDHKRCASNLDSATILSPRSEYQKASQIGNDLSLIINHDERICEDVYNGQCYYVVALIGTSEDQEFSTYTISINHSQLNYFVLSEGSMVTDYVNLGSYRYYSFTLLQDAKVKNVTFKLNTLHGDADIFISRKHPYPNKLDYEKSSVKTNIDEDQIYFDDANVSSTYYIGVQSFQYSTYNLVVKVNRQGLVSNDENLPLLSEGVPFIGTIYGADNPDSYRFYVKQLSGYEKAIKIQVQSLKGKFDIYVNYDQRASSSSKIWSTKESAIEIKTTDRKFKREGYYYVTISPRASIWTRLTDDNYKYIVMYSTKDSYSYLSSSQSLESTQTGKSSQYFRHFINHKNDDISVSMTVFNGDPQMYISINPDNKLPSQESNEFNSRNQAVISGNKGKSIYIPNQQVLKSNYACSQNIENYVDIEPCAVFVGVFCENDCKYSIKLSYEKGAPQKLVIGVPQHDIVKDSGINYYYLIVREDKTNQIYAVLNSLSGNADLYVNFQDNPMDLAPEKWKLPTSSSYAIKSTEILKQDMVNISPSNLKDCFGRQKDNGQNEDRQCAIVFGIYSPLGSQTEDIEDKYSTRYNFVVYSDIIFLSNGAAMSGKVDEKEFQYYIFEALCHDCPIIVSVSSFSNGDPDLYISFGDSQLPTLKNYDIWSSTFKSELVRISLDSEEVRNKKIKTLRGSLIIGVYGVKKSDFSISVTQEKNPITTLVSGYSLKVSQQPYETTYFMYYHDKDQKDFLLQVNPKAGLVDIYMETFIDNDSTQNFADRLPKSKRNAWWVVENIKPLSSQDEKQILVLNEEKHYCSHCYYLIAVISHDIGAEYNVLVHYLDANFENSLLLKVGESQPYQLEKDQTAYFKFMIDDYQSFQVQFTQITGYAQAYLNLKETKKDSIEIFSGSASITIDTVNPNFKVGQMYYLIVESSTDSEFSILINQQKQILELSDGIPLRIDFLNQETSRHLVFALPAGEQQIDLQIKSKTINFRPILYYKYVEDISNANSLEFPPSGTTDFKQAQMWERAYNLLNVQDNITVNGDKGGLIISVYTGHIKEKFEGSPLIFVTVTTSSTVQMMPMNTYSGTLKTPNSFMIYQVDQFLDINIGNIMIEFANCQGNAKLEIIEKQEGNKSKSIETELNEIQEFGRTYYFVPLPRKNLFIMIKTSGGQDWDGESAYEQSEYLLKIRFNPNSNFKQRFQFHYQLNNKITIDNFSSLKHTANLTWHSLLISDASGAIRKLDSQYTIVVTLDKKINLESICAVRNEGLNTNSFFYHSNKTNFNVPGMKTGVRYYANVFGKMDIPYSGEEEIVPYEAFEIHIRENMGLFTLINAIAILSICLIIFITCFVIQRLFKKKEFYREKQPGRQVEYELTSVNAKGNNSTVGEYQRPTDLINDAGETESLNAFSNALGRDNENRSYGF